MGLSYWKVIVCAYRGSWYFLKIYNFSEYENLIFLLTLYRRSILKLAWNNHHSNFILFFKCSLKYIIKSRNVTYEHKFHDINIVSSITAERIFEEYSSVRARRNDSYFVDVKSFGVRAPKSSSPLKITEQKLLIHKLSANHVEVGIFRVKWKVRLFAQHARTGGLKYDRVQNKIRFTVNRKNHNFNKYVNCHLPFSFTTDQVNVDLHFASAVWPHIDLHY